MRKLANILCITALCCSTLPGCAQQQGPQTPQQQADTSCTAFGPKTTTGAAAGALLGALVGGVKAGGKGALIGAASGAVAGGLVGKIMDHNDCKAAQVALRQMETAKVGTPIPWSNASTGNSGVFVPTSAPAMADGRVCRNYTRQATVGGQTSAPETGVTCRDANGDWSAVS